MGATFVIDVETGSTRKNLEAVTAAFEAGKISSKEYAAAVLAAAKAMGQFEAASSLAKKSFAQIGADLFKANTQLGAYVSATNQASASLKKFAAASNIRTAFADRSAVELYNSELKKSIQLQGQLVAMEDKEYASIVRSNAALQAQNAIRKQSFQTGAMIAKADVIRASSLSSYDKTQMMVQMGVASAFKSTAAEATKTAGAIDKATGSTRAGSQAFTAYGSALRGVAGSMGALWMSYGQVLPLMAAFASAQAVKQVYALGSQFEYTAEYVATLGKYSGQATRSVSELREELLDVADTRHNINDLGAGIKEFSKAGVDVATSLKDIGEMSRFASVAEMELADATKLVIGQANAFGESYSDAANMISAAALSSATDIGEMATAMSYTTELGSVAKVEFSEVAAAMGVLANNGIRGSKAGTSLRTSILRMQNPTKKLQGILKELNLDWSAFSDEGKVKSIQAMFTELKRATDEMALTDQQMSELQYELFGFRSLKGGANLLKDITTGFVEMHESVTRSTEGVTFLQQATNDLADTATVKWDKVKVAFSNALTGAFENGEALSGFLDGLKALAESNGLQMFLSGVAESVSLLGQQIANALGPLEALINLGIKAGELSGNFLQEMSPVSLDPGSNIDKMGKAFRDSLNPMLAYKNSFESLGKVVDFVSDGFRQNAAAIPVPAIGTGVGIRSTGVSDPFGSNPITQKMSGIDNALTDFFGEIDFKAKSNAIVEAAGKYVDATDQIAKARASLDDRIFSTRRSGGSAYEQYQYALEAANREVEKLQKSNAEIGSGPGMENLTQETIAYGAALRAAAEEKFKLAESKAIAGLGKDIAEFMKQSAEPLTEYEQGLARIDAAVAGLRAAAGEKAIELYGSDTPENLKKINDLLGGQIDKLAGVADAQKEAFSDRLILEWQDRLSDLSKEYGQLSRHEEAVFAVTSKFTKEQESLNKTFKEGSPEAIRFSNSLKQMEAYALATDTAILKTSDSIRNGLVASLREAAKEMMTFGELGATVGEELISGIKQSISDTIIELDFDKDALGDLWEGVWQNVSRTGADFVADQLVGTASSFLGDLIGVDLSGLTGQAPTGASGSPFHVIVENWEGAGLLDGAFGGENDNWWGGAEAKTGVMGWLSQYLGPEVAEAVKMVGGAVGVAGGVYGMYSGAKDVSDGNFGAGALKMGTGAVSAYKGAVALNIIEEGTATKIGAMIGEKVASWTGQKGLEIAADVATKTAAQTASQVAATSSASLAGQGATYAASSSVNAGTQLALAEGTYGASGGAAGAGAGAYAGMFALPAMVAGMAVASALADSPGQRKRDSLNIGQVHPLELMAEGVTDQFTRFSNTLRTTVNPALVDATIGSYDAGSGLLMLGKQVEEVARTGVDGQGRLVDSIQYTTVRWDELAGAWKTVDNPIGMMVEQLKELAPATLEAAAASAQMIAAQAGYPGLADEVLLAYNEQKVTAQGLTGEITTLSGRLANMRDTAGYTASSMLGLTSSMGAAASASETVSSAEERRRGILSGLAGAANTATANFNAQQNATNSLASAAGAAAGRIGQAAGDIGGAVGRIGGLLARAATYSDPNYQGHADGAIFKYHAVGGVMTQPTVFHIGGEAGTEAILPLHRGPQTLEFIDRKIDDLVRNSVSSDEMRAILVAVATYTKKSADILKRFEYIGIPTSKREAVA